MRIIALLVTASLAVALGGCGGHPGRELTGPNTVVIQELQVHNWEFQLSCGHAEVEFGTVFFPKTVVVDSIVVLECEYQGDGYGHNGEQFALLLNKSGQPLHWLPEEPPHVTADPPGFVGHMDVNLGGVSEELVGNYELEFVHASAVLGFPAPPGDNDVSFDTVVIYYHELE